MKSSLTYDVAEETGQANGTSSDTMTHTLGRKEGETEDMEKNGKSQDTGYDEIPTFVKQYLAMTSYELQ